MTYNCFNNIAGIPAGGQCWSQTSGVASQRCSSGTECLPWTPGGGSLYCLYSPPLTEGAECDYWERKGPCEEGINCTDGWCKGTLSSRWPQNSCIILQGSLQVANVGARTVELPHKGAALVLSVCPGHLGEAPGMGPVPSTASISSLWHTWSLVTTLRRGSCVTQASCVRGSVLELTSTCGSGIR